MARARRTPELGTPGHSRNIDRNDARHHDTDGPRGVVEIRDELIEIGRQAWATGTGVDPHRLSELATELLWAASFARLFGGDATATERYAAATAETAHLAALLRDRAREAA